MDRVPLVPTKTDFLCPRDFTSETKSLFYFVDLYALRPLFKKLYLSVFEKAFLKVFDPFFGAKPIRRGLLTSYRLPKPVNLSKEADRFILKTSSGSSRF